MSWDDILKRKGAHINRRSMGMNQMGNTIGIGTKKESEPIHEDAETNEKMQDWNKTISEIQDMLTSLKRHPVTEYPADGRQEMNDAIESISNEIDLKLTFTKR